MHVVSLAIDKLDNKPKLLKIIEEYQTDWAQIFLDDQQEGKQYLKACEVQAFPTTILIDPKGDVVYRGSAEAAIEKVDELLEDIL